MGEVTLYADPPDGFTLYRRVVEAGVEIPDHRKASDGPGYWTPCVSSFLFLELVNESQTVSSRSTAQSLRSAQKISLSATSTIRIIRRHLGRTFSSSPSFFRMEQDELSVMEFLRLTNTLQLIRRARSWQSCTRKKESRDRSMMSSGLFLKRDRLEMCWSENSTLDSRLWCLYSRETLIRDDSNNIDCPENLE